jgi:hypothetical protein
VYVSYATDSCCRPQCRHTTQSVILRTKTDLQKQHESACKPDYAHLPERPSTHHTFEVYWVTLASVHKKPCKQTHAVSAHRCLLAHDMFFSTLTLAAQQMKATNSLTLAFQQCTHCSRIHCAALMHVPYRYRPPTLIQRNSGTNSI